MRAEAPCESPAAVAAGRRNTAAQPVARQLTGSAERGQDSARDETCRNSATKSGTFKREIADRPNPLNILGGFRWPNAIQLKPGVLQTIIETTVGGRVIQIDRDDNQAQQPKEPWKDAA